MIESKDLHHNGLYSFKGKTVKCDLDDEITFEWDNGHYDQLYLKDLTPIPLTVDWIKRLGFILASDGTYTYNEICIEPKTHQVTIFYDNQWDNVTHTTYVHQLQNIYRAITGFDMEIKIKDFIPDPQVDEVFGD